MILINPETWQKALQLNSWGLTLVENWISSKPRNEETIKFLSFCQSVAKIEIFMCINFGMLLHITNKNFWVEVVFFTVFTQSLIFILRLNIFNFLKSGTLPSPSMGSCFSMNQREKVVISSLTNSLCQASWKWTGPKYHRTVSIT